MFLFSAGIVGPCGPYLWHLADLRSLNEGPDMHWYLRTRAGSGTDSPLWTCLGDTADSLEDCFPSRHCLLLTQLGMVPRPVTDMCEKTRFWLGERTYPSPYHSSQRVCVCISPHFTASHIHTVCPFNKPDYVAVEVLGICTMEPVSWELRSG